MDSFFSRYRSVLVLLAVLFAQIIGIASQMRRQNYGGEQDGHHVRVVRTWSAYTITPMERILHAFGSGVRETWHSYIDLRHVRQHNKDLQYQIDELRLQEAALSEDARQGQRLQKLLAFKQNYAGHMIAAQVLGTAGDDKSHVITIDRGAGDGVRPDMAVITPNGIVGKVRDVFPGSAQVLLISDSSSGAGVILVNTRTRGVLRGSHSGQVQINDLLPDDRIKAGEPVVTSGGDRIYPRGLPVGSVESAALDPSHPPYAKILIRPAADLNRLEEVLVLLDTSDQQPQAEGEPADGAQKASQIVAQRLPGLPTDAASDPSKPGAAAPLHVLPALHPDRYSPGSVPPASELKPGAGPDANAMPAPNGKEPQP